MTWLLVFAGLTACGSHQTTPARDDSTVDARVKVGPVMYVFRASPLSNLTYELDCLAELIPCSREAFKTM